MLLLLLSQIAASAPPPVPVVTLSDTTPVATASTLLDRYRRRTDPTASRDCVIRDSGEIIVCAGAGRASPRLGHTDDSDSGEALIHDTTGRAALAALQRPCPLTGCTGINLIAVPVKLFQIAKALITNNG